MHSYFTLRQSVITTVEGKKQLLVGEKRWVMALAEAKAYQSEKHTQEKAGERWEQSRKKNKKKLDHARSDRYEKKTQTQKDKNELQII